MDVEGKFSDQINCVHIQRTLLCMTKRDDGTIVDNLIANRENRKLYKFGLLYPRKS